MDEAEDSGGDIESLLGDRDRKTPAAPLPPKWVASVFFGDEFKTAAAAAAATNFPS